MFLQSLSLQYFKNYEKVEVSFCDHFNCLVGINGSGKTNVLDAIHYLSTTKSAFHALDAQSINHDGQYFVINGQFCLNDKESKVHCSLKKNSRKTFKVDDYEYEKLSEHVGKFPIVLIAPNDDELIRESNETRRKFFNSIISQYDQKYLHSLIKYNHHLKQRNALLKSMNESGRMDDVMIEAYNEPLIVLGQEIAKTRKSFIKEFLPHLQANYDRISDKREKVSVVYHTKVLDKNFAEQLAKGTQKDVITQRTNLGIHRDEYLFEIDDFLIKKYGSQGQQKSLLISLKLAQFEFIKSHLGQTPILLLDDIFDKLDDGRISQLMSIIGSNDFGQVFVTDAREERTRSLLQGKFEPMKIFQVSGNTIQELD
ncbi:DNA replication and repair protein RecF [Reichenbachiella faecimaris]|uniref:DNA replication and repair protein RecF n=1 Tax=Reichenbachiella faecimaris TaxID=692418 RepID=A0A1W2GE56_REIFA|nr:DNA replication/repair protein RecF [Reichenbachiella faecimaris]SMD34935.1 DNA replication and repair protein RecF [Reichenbachiella faecimaris]